MKKIKITIYLLLFICLSIFGQQPKTVSIQVQPQKTSTQVFTSQQESIKQLQAENEAMKAQLEKMEKEIELYRGDVRTETSKMDTHMAQWLAILTIIMAILGVLVPLILSRRNENFMERMLDDVKQQAISAEKQAQEATTQAVQAKQAVVDIEGLKKHVTAVEERINNDAIAAEKAAKEAKASQLLTQALSEEDPLKSIELCTKAIEINPDFAVAYYNRGNIKDKLQDYVGELNDYNQAIKLKPNFEYALFNRANIKVKLGDYEGAISDFSKVIELNPNENEAYINRGNIKARIGDVSGALADYNKAISLNQDYPEAYYNRGILKSKMGDHVGAILDFDKSINLNMSYLKAYINRAISYRELAEVEQDPEKKADLIAKAEADEKKTESLKEGNKA